MNGYENPSIESAHAVFKLSWLAYVSAVFSIMLFMAISVGISIWTLYNAQSDAAFRLGMTISVFVLVLSLSVCIYNVLFLRSVRVYTDNVGVWLYRGILPWSKGVRGVKWRDIEDAMYYTGFLSWMFRSHTVRIGHRFTKTSEIYVHHLAHGQNAVEHINQLHQSILRGEQSSAAELEV